MFLCMAAVRPPGVVGLSQPQFVPPLACLNVTLVVWYPSSLVVGVFLSSFWCSCSSFDDLVLFC